MEQPLASSAASVALSSASSAPSRDTPSGVPAANGSMSPALRPLPIEDERTLSQLRRGHSAAIEDLVERYQDRLFATVLRLVGHPEDAADLVQETFVKAMQNVAKFEGKSSLYTWLFRIAVNLALSHRRSRTYRDAVSLDNAADDDGVNQQAAGLHRQLSQGTESDPAVLAEIHQEHERVIVALNQLEPDFRAIIVLRDIEDCDYEQMAAILEIPVGTVKSRLFRARTALREAVGPRKGSAKSNGRPS